MDYLSELWIGNAIHITTKENFCKYVKLSAMKQQQIYKEPYVISNTSYCFKSIFELALPFCCCCCCWCCWRWMFCWDVGGWCCCWNIIGLTECCGIKQLEGCDSPFSSAVAIFSLWTSAVSASFRAIRRGYRDQK